MSARPNNARADAPQAFGQLPPAVVNSAGKSSLAGFEASAIALLREAVALGPAALASSMGKEDQAMTALIAREKLPISIFTLDTGRLPPQTLDLIAQTEARYRLRIRVLFPESDPWCQWVSGQCFSAKALL